MTESQLHVLRTVVTNRLENIGIGAPDKVEISQNGVVIAFWGDEIRKVGEIVDNKGRLTNDPISGQFIYRLDLDGGRAPCEE